MKHEGFFYKSSIRIPPPKKNPTICYLEEKEMKSQGAVFWGKMLISHLSMETDLVLRMQNQNDYY